ncbi:hypothetical protein LINPERHAP2_LOCUS29600 [Linum perenne]
MEKSSKREIIKAEEEGNRSWWQQCILTCLPAAAATVLISWISGGRKQSQQQLDDDEDHHPHQNSALTSTDAEEQGIPIYSSVSDNVGDSQTVCTQSVTVSESVRHSSGKKMAFTTDWACISNDGGGEVIKFERFKVKPRNFMNVSSKN